MIYDLVRGVSSIYWHARVDIKVFLQCNQNFVMIYYYTVSYVLIEQFHRKNQ